MTRATLIIAAIAFFCSTEAATSPPVMFESPCECRDNHGKHRWSVKIDASLPPTDTNAVQAVTPSNIYSWPGPDVRLTGQSGRTGIENNWYAVTGRVLAAKAETDGDLHIELQDVTGDKPGVVIVEVPAKPQWCEIRIYDTAGNVIETHEHKGEGVVSVSVKQKSRHAVKQRLIAPVC